MKLRHLSITFVGVILAGFVCVEPCRAIMFSPFGDFGQGGTGRGQTFTIGTAGEVFWNEGFLDVGGDLQFLNQDLIETYNLDFAFSPFLTPDGKNLFLHYAFTNTGPAETPSLKVYTWLDVDLGTDSENDTAYTTGNPGSGASDPDPDGFEIADVFDFETGKSLGDRLSGNPADVVLSLEFNLGVLAPGETVGVNLLLSENGRSIGSLALTQGDTETEHGTVLTYSGRVGAPIPEPATLATMALGLLLPAFQRLEKAVRNRSIHRKA